MNFQLLCLLQGKVALDDVNENPRTLRPGVRLAVLKVTLANEEVLLGQGAILTAQSLQFLFSLGGTVATTQLP